MTQPTRLQLKITDHRQALLGAGPAGHSARLTVPERVQGLPPGPTRALAIIRANAEAFRDRPAEIASSPYPKLFALIDKHTIAFMQLGESGSVQAVDMLVNAVKTPWETEMSGANLAKIGAFLELADTFIPATTNLAAFKSGIENISELVLANGLGADLLPSLLGFIDKLKAFHQGRGASVSTQAVNSLADSIRILWEVKLGGADLAKLQTFLSLTELFIPSATDLARFTAAISDCADLAFRDALKPSLLCALFPFIDRAELIDGSLAITGRNNLPDQDTLADGDLQALAGFLQQYWRHLVALNFFQCNRITDQGLAHLAGLTNLAILTLQYCVKITDQGLAHLAGLTKLSDLKIQHGFKITDQGLAHLSSLSNLSSLELSAAEITDQGLIHLKALTKLSSLDLSGCREITDQGLRHLGTLAGLSVLDLRFNFRISDRGLEHLKGLSKLSSLNLDRCDSVTGHGKQKIKGALPGLVIVNYG
jgi:hypothetical protein